MADSESSFWDNAMVDFADSNDVSSRTLFLSILAGAMNGSGDSKSKSSSSSKSFSSKYTALCKDPKVDFVLDISIFRFTPMDCDGGLAAAFPWAFKRVDWSGLAVVAEWFLTAFLNITGSSAACSGPDVVYFETICGINTGPFKKK
jgi:hypothetical protein